MFLNRILVLLAVAPFAAAIEEQELLSTVRVTMKHECEYGQLSKALISSTASNVVQSQVQTAFQGVAMRTDMDVKGLS
jgi:hypothetical protein